VILDRIENAAIYRALGPNIARALDYLEHADFDAIADGRHEIDGDRVFAIVSHLELKPLAEALWETHRKYIDMQYVVHGMERMGFACLRDDVPVAQPYDAQKDAAFYNVAGDFFSVPQGTFVLFAPQDIHAPGLRIEPAGGRQSVRKVVVKCQKEKTFP
jgi:biofilm protein TabA